MAGSSPRRLAISCVGIGVTALVSTAACDRERTAPGQAATNAAAQLEADKLRERVAGLQRTVHTLKTKPNTAVRAVPDRQPRETRAPAPIPPMLTISQLIVSFPKYQGKVVQVRGRLAWRDVGAASSVRKFSARCNSIGPAGDEIYISYRSAGGDLRSKFLRFRKCKAVYVLGRALKDEDWGITIELAEVATKPFKPLAASPAASTPRPVRSARRSAQPAHKSSHQSVLAKELRGNCKRFRVTSRTVLRFGRTGITADGTCVHRQFGVNLSFSCVCTDTGCGCDYRPL